MRITQTHKLYFGSVSNSTDNIIIFIIIMMPLTLVTARVALFTAEAFSSVCLHVQYLDLLM